MTTRHRPFRRAGFTLIESMATVVVLGVLGSIASFLVLGTVDGYMDATTAAQLHAEMSIAMDRMTREIRRIELDSGASGVAPNITSMTFITLIWEDSDGDEYRLNLSGSDLQLKVDGGPLATLLTDVTSLNIAIFDEDNANTGPVCSDAGCDDVRRVELDVECQREGVTERLRSRVFIRSTMAGAQGG